MECKTWLLDSYILSKVCLRMEINCHKAIYKTAIDEMIARRSLVLEKDFIDNAIRGKALNASAIYEDALDLLTSNAERLNADDFEVLMEIAFAGLHSKNSIPLLNRLIRLPNHQKHEDIAQLLQEYHDPSSIESLTEAAKANYPYLEWDKNRGLTRKCMWALAAIDTSEAWNSIERFSNSNESIVKQWAEEQLNRRNV